MPAMQPESDDSARPLFLLGGVILLVVALLALSKGDEPPGAAPEPRGGGGGGAGIMVPGAPVDGVVNSPVPGGPGVTVVEDVRETLYRLPLDRNTPQGWTNPAPKPR